MTTTWPRSDSERNGLPAVVGSSKAGIAVGCGGAVKPFGKSAAMPLAHETTSASAARRVRDFEMADANDISTYLQRRIPAIYSETPRFIPTPRYCCFAATSSLQERQTRRR